MSVTCSHNSKSHRAIDLLTNYVQIPTRCSWHTFEPSMLRTSKNSCPALSRPSKTVTVGSHTGLAIDSIYLNRKRPNDWTYPSAWVPVIIALQYSLFAGASFQLTQIAVIVNTDSCVSKSHPIRRSESKEAVHCASLLLRLESSYHKGQGRACCTPVSCSKHRDTKSEGSSTLACVSVRVATIEKPRTNNTILILRQWRRLAVS